MSENKSITKEFLKKAREAKTPEELMELAKTEKIELSQEDAKVYFEKLSNLDELSDDELDNIAGGASDFLKASKPFIL